jgi:hypothetical protein
MVMATIEMSGRDFMKGLGAKRHSSKSARCGRKSAATRASMKFTIQYVRKSKHTKPLTFELASIDQARKLARIASELKDTSVQSFTITSEGGRSETWLYRRGTWRQKPNEQ